MGDTHHVQVETYRGKQMMNQWRVASHLLFSMLATVILLSEGSTLANICQLHSANGKITRVIYLQFDNV